MGAKAHEPLLAAYSSDLTYAADIFEDARQEAGGVFCATLSSIDVLVPESSRLRGVGWACFSSTETSYIDPNNP
jgi:hypothetical protein